MACDLNYKFKQIGIFELKNQKNNITFSLMISLNMFVQEKQFKLPNTLFVYKVNYID